MLEEGPIEHGAALTSPTMLLGGRILTIALVLLVSYASYAGLSNGPCGGSGGTPNVNPHSGAAAICNAWVPGWNGTTFPSDFKLPHAGSSGRSGVVSWTAVLLPVVIVLLGLFASVRRETRRWFRLAVVFAIVLIIAPWVGLGILSA